MSGSKRRETVNMEEIPLGSRIGEHPSAVYDRTDLAKTPLAKLVGMSGIVVGKKNPLDGFTDQINSALRKLDEDYRTASHRYDSYVSICGKGNTGKAAEMRDAIKQDLIELRGEIAEILEEKFKMAFEFLVDDLEDDQLEKTNMGVSQKKIATILYDHLDHYEDKYSLGKGVTVQVMTFAKLKAEEKGDRIVKNVERDEMDIRLLQGQVAGATSTNLRGTLPGIGEVMPSMVKTLPPPNPVLASQSSPLTAPVRPPEGYLPPPPSRKPISTVKQTLPPAPFVPDPNLPKPGDRYITGRTDPFMPGAIVPGSYEDQVRKEAEASVAGIDFKLSRISPIPGYDDVIASTDVAEEAPEIEDTDRTEIMAGRDLPSILEDSDADEDTKPDSIIPPTLQTPTAPRSFSSADVPGMVEGTSVSYGPGITAPAPRSGEVESGAKVVLAEGIQAEISDRAKLERAQTEPEITTANLKKIEAPIEEDERTVITQRSKILTPPVKESWLKRAGDGISSWYKNAKASASKFYEDTKSKLGSLYKSAKEWILPKLRKVAKPVAVAAGLTAMAIAGGHDSTSSMQKKANLADSAESAKAAASTLASASAAPSASDVNKKAEAPTDSTKAVEPKQASTTPEYSATFADVLVKSKSPFVQQLIKEGKLTIGTQSITDAIIGSMRGLTTNEQKLQVAELERQINLGLGVYFYEHFGTPAKVAESMKDPNLKNLYRTAKHAQEKGWFSSYHTKEKFPEAYLLATELLGDSHELGHDASDNPSAKVKASVQGNMFQAKLPGSTINMKKANGHYHVVAEYMMGILEGKDVKEMMKAELAAVSAKDAGNENQAETKKDVPAGQQQGGTKVEKKDAGKNGTFLPNIIGPQGLGMLGVSNDVDGGRDELIDKADKAASDKATFEKTGTVEFDLPLSMTTKQENDAILPTVIEKVIAMNPQADAAKITKLMKQYGFIGIKSWARSGKPGHFKVELHPNFLRILKPELKKSLIKVS